jgi:hypothetical protein
VVDVGQEVVDDQVLVVDELEHNSDVRLKINERYPICPTCDT